ncbi:hypothetical protein ACET9Q_05215 [Aeromonas caviae]|uniref:hypothetical protein n=1 Tax=Aeromonas caviae TaxID=648 RepID=UPI0038D1E9CF
MNDLTAIIAGFSTFLLIIYFLCAFYGSISKPDLLEALSLILTSSGAVSAIKLGYICIVEPSIFTGPLADQRVPILAGAFAILWVSVSVTLKLFLSHIEFSAESSSEPT